jgi:signal transduction histidine kinase
MMNWKKAFPGEMKVILVFVLVFKIYHGFSNVMQWGGFTMVFDAWEDYLEIMIPGLWAGFIVLFIVWKQKEDLLKVDRMRDALVRDVSHELKTPVAKHAMQMEIIRPVMESHNLTGEERKALGVMESSIRRQERVISNLLDLSRLEDGRREFRREPVELGGVCRKVMDDFRYETEKHGVELTCSVPPIWIESDEAMLWHLFSNLVGNAVKFSRGQETAKVDISAEQVGGTVTLRVVDSGRGMSPEELGRAFDRFYQGSASVEGSGVGLSICESIAEGLGCELTLESPGKGQGVTAAITFPLRP